MELIELKLEARRAIRGRHPSAFLVSLAYYLLLVLLAVLTQRLAMTVLRLPELLSLSEQMVQAATAAEQERILEAAVALTDARERFGEYVLLAIEIMEMMLTMGFFGYCLGLLRDQEGSVGSLFDAFGNFLRFLGMNALIYIVTSLLSLLLIPGVIASYCYALAPYLLMDDPRRGPVECMRESREWMRGNKLRLFLLDLSMLGWYIASVIPGPSVYALPYICAVRANFYRAVTGRRDAPEHIDVSI